MVNKSRIVFHNPHSIWYKQTIGNFYNGRTYWNGKYGYLIDQAIGHYGKIYYIKTPGKYARDFSSKKTRLIEKFKFYLWVRINQYKSNLFVELRPEELSNHDILLTHINPYFSDIQTNSNYHQFHLEYFKRVKCKIYINLSHYGYNTNVSAEILEKIKNKIYFWSESDVTLASGYFKKNYEWYNKKILIIPFVPQERFRSNLKFSSRLNKCLAIGTLTYKMKDKNFLSYFPDGILQPNRNAIYEQKENLIQFIDCKISPMSDKQNITNSPLWNLIFGLKKTLVFLVKVLIPPLDISLKKFDRNYFDFDMVEVFNKYKMFVCPEETIGISGIGHAEGMLCGSVLIGEKAFYTGTGMIENKHYISYDGSIEDLQMKIEYYQNNPLKLEEIRTNSLKFANRAFRAQTVFNKFLSHAEL